jgi:hypothetical protein
MMLRRNVVDNLRMKNLRPRTETTSESSERESHIQLNDTLDHQALMKMMLRCQSLLRESLQGLRQRVRCVQDPRVSRGDGR